MAKTFFKIHGILRTMKIIIDVIKNLETSLLQSSTRQSTESLNQLLADDFIEFGVSGKIYNKKDILALLPKEQHSNEIILFDFEMK